MIDFYALTIPNVQKIYIMLEETGLPYKEIFIDVWKGAITSRNFSRSTRTARYRRSSTTMGRPASPIR